MAKIVRAVSSLVGQCLAEGLFNARAAMLTAASLDAYLQESQKRRSVVLRKRVPSSG